MRRLAIALAAPLALAATGIAAQAAPKPVYKAIPLQQSILPGHGTAGVGLVFPGPVTIPAGPPVFLAVPQDPRTVPTAQRPNLPGSLTLPAAYTKHAAHRELLDESTLRSLWERAGAAYGIPWYVLAAINKIESNFGRNMGPSSAGAVGWMQFMPGTWLRWGLDANADGLADPWNAEDAVYSAARYLAASGGAKKLRRAILAYNHADWYANEVIQLANLYSTTGLSGAFTLDRLQQSLTVARQTLAKTNELEVRAVAGERALAAAAARLDARMQATTSLSDRLDLERKDFAAHGRMLAAQAVVRRLDRKVADAAHRVRKTRIAARPPAFAPAAASLLASASFAGGYVFPVGGGPSRVSVGHTHHDYPAADIAAPTGSPVYALASSVVLQTWTSPAFGGACGIGIQLQTRDGVTWTYCHLSYLDPVTQPGARLDGGTEVGLVGSTGDATGPHLHLQLDPPDSYPQALPWFQRFVGTAFRWSDGPATAQPAGAPVFSAVPTAGRTLATAPGTGAVFQVLATNPAPAAGTVVLFHR